MEHSVTEELGAKRVSLVKVFENGSVSKEKSAGLEWGPPALGMPYVIYLGKGRYLKTSPVRELKEIHNALMFKTANSVYRIEYVKKPAADMQRLTQTLENW
jgi:hypothetical protein